VIDSVLSAGARIRAHDPQAIDEAHRILQGREGFKTVADPYAAAAGADALVLMTEWKQYWAPDFDRLCREMKQPVIVDGRNIWAPDAVRRRGITYYGIGRP
jgi:UDPglucose 6-dehydrogenase